MYIFMRDMAGSGFSRVLIPCFQTGIMALIEGPLFGYRTLIQNNPQGSVLQTSDPETVVMSGLAAHKVVTTKRRFR